MSGGKSRPMKPLCWKCKKPVEGFYIRMASDCFEHIYIAECHGEVETMTLSGEEMMLIRLGIDTIVEFVAFRERKEIEGNGNLGTNRGTREIG